jgi:hypothetical protein
VPLLAGLLAFSALALGRWELAVASLVLGLAVGGLWRNLVVEIGPVGITRGFALKDAFLGRVAVLPWHGVVEIRTEWTRPGDDSALETAVRGRDGTTIRLSTAMGLRSYWTCLAEIARRAPRAVRSGLTESALAEGPPGRRHVLPALVTAGALALVIVALAGLHYVWSQGRSSLSRYLEQVGAAPAPSPASCSPQPGAERDPPGEPRTDAASDCDEERRPAR